MWQQLPFSLPANNQVVWIRIDRWSGAPFLAQWRQQQQQFNSQINDIAYPAYMVSVWRVQ